MRLTPIQRLAGGTALLLGTAGLIWLTLVREAQPVLPGDPVAATSLANLDTTRPIVPLPALPPTPTPPLNKTPAAAAPVSS